MIENRIVSHRESSVEIVSSLESLQAAMPEWRIFLSGRVQGSNLFNDPAHIELQLKTNPDYIPLIIILRGNDQIRCIAPFYLHKSRFRLQVSVLKLASLPIQMLSVFGDDFILAADEDTNPWFEKIFSVLKQHSLHYGLIYFDRLIVSTPLWEYLTRRKKNFRFYLASAQMEKNHDIHFPGTYEEYLAALNPSTRRNLRRYARKLCSEHHAYLERITKAEQVPLFLDQVDQVFKETWQAKTFGYYPRNATNQIAYYRGLAELGWLRSYLLANENGPIAFEIVFQYGEVAYSHERGFIQAWGESRPGTALTFLFIEDFYRDSLPQHFDFGLGDAAYKRSFANVTREAAAVYVAPANRWRWILRLQRVLSGIDHGVRSLLITLRLDRAVRKFLKRQN